MKSLLKNVSLIAFSCMLLASCSNKVATVAPLATSNTVQAKSNTNDTVSLSVKLSADEIKAALKAKGLNTSNYKISKVDVVYSFTSNWQETKVTRLESILPEYNSGSGYINGVSSTRTVYYALHVFVSVDSKTEDFWLNNNGQNYQTQVSK